MPEHYYWKPCSNGAVPEGATVCGHDKDGTNLYVGRAFHQGDMLPAKIAPSHGCAYVSYNGVEYGVKQYEAAVGSDFVWQSSSGGHVPPDAVVVGETASGERLYVGRVLHDATLTLGKVHPSHGVCYIPYAGKELSFQCYDVLVCKH